jgi:hypothetical protein
LVTWGTIGFSKGYHFTLLLLLLLLYIKQVQKQRQVEGKAFHVGAMKAYRRNRSKAPVTLNFCIIWRWVMNITPMALYTHDRTPVFTEQGAEWAP